MPHYKDYLNSIQSSKWSFMQLHQRLFKWWGNPLKEICSSQEKESYQKYCFMQLLQRLFKWWRNPLKVLQHIIFKNEIHKIPNSTHSKSFNKYSKRRFILCVSDLGIKLWSYNYLIKNIFNAQINYTFLKILFPILYALN